MNCGMNPINLCVCGVPEPLGIGTKRPVFSWKLESPLRSQRQTAYRILVAESFEKLEEDIGSLWDSGVVQSGATFEIPYEGVRLGSACRYYWKLMVWDQEERPSEWSAGQWFETGLLHKADWQGTWIRAKASARPLEGLKWIGHPNTHLEKVSFVKSIALPEGAEVRQAWFDGTADAGFTLYVGGSTVAKSNPEWGQDYKSPFCYIDFADKLHGDDNRIICEAFRDGGGASFIGLFRILLGDGEELVFSTDETWQAAEGYVVQDGLSATGDLTKYNAVVTERYGEGEHGSPVRHGAVPLLRTEFRVDGPIRAARLYYCGLGYGDVQVNGQRLDDSLLNMPYTQYSKRVYYKTCDVTSLLRPGKNCLGVELGRGYYGCHRDWIGDGVWCDEPKLLLQLRITGEDGCVRTVFTDEHWRTSEGPTLDDSVWYGEVYDANRGKPGWAMAGYDDSAWERAIAAEAPEGCLETVLLPPIRVCERISCKILGRPKPGIVVYDAGKVTAGRAVITVREFAGTRVKITYGEHLREDGLLDAWKDGTDFQFWQTPQVDRYICSGVGEESWAPKFSYSGFRYIMVEGLHGPCEVVAEVFHNDVARIGEFHCSSPLFESIHRMCTDTILNNLHSIPTDTPMHEKRGWTGDGQVIADCACRNFDMKNFFEKWVQDIEDSQSERGEISHTCPGPHQYAPTPAWMSALILVPWSLYMSYGDQSVLVKHYGAFQKYLDYEIERLHENVSSDRYYGDWCVPGSDKGPEGSALFATVYVYRACDLMAEISTILEREEEGTRYRDIADRIRETVNAVFYDSATDTYHTQIEVGYRQSSNVLPLAFGMAPEGRKQAVAAGLARDVGLTNGNHLTTGCFGTRYLAPMLSEHGFNETAYRLADQRTYPSWGYWVENGATACLEGWDFDARSYDHYFLGTIDDWFYEYLVGIRPRKPGYREIVIRPYPPKEMESAGAKVETTCGPVYAEWTKSDNLFELHAGIPANTTAEIWLPKGTQILETGLPAELAEGVAFIREESGSLVYRVESGSYCFSIAGLGHRGAEFTS